MRHFKCLNWATCGVIASLYLLSGSAALAQQKSGIPGKFSWNLALASEYVFRGLTQTDEGPALQGGMDYEYNLSDDVMIYAGLWASNVDFNESAAVDGATIETDFYGGLKGKIGRTGASWNAGLIYYAYPAADSSLDYDYVEFTMGGAYDFGFAEVNASVNYSPEYFGNSGEAIYTKIGANIPIPWVKGLSVSGHVGDQYIENSAAFGTPDYFDWALALGYVADGLFNASIQYSDTDVTPETAGKDETIVFTIGKKF
jgi:uncharacterized protein (TIGR02001 family)